MATKKQTKKLIRIVKMYYAVQIDKMLQNMTCDSIDIGTFKQGVAKSDIPFIIELGKLSLDKARQTHIADSPLWHNFLLAHKMIELLILSKITPIYTKAADVEAYIAIEQIHQKIKKTPASKNKKRLTYWFVRYGAKNLFVGIQRFARFVEKPWELRKTIVEDFNYEKEFQDYKVYQTHLQQQNWPTPEKTDKA